MNPNTALPKIPTSTSSGFTIVELLVVIVILGILSTVTMSILRPSFFYGRGRDARRQSDLNLVKGALEQYYLDNGRLYPDNSYAYVDLETPLGPYLDSFPTDPGSSSYVYAVSSDQKCYELSGTMEVEAPVVYKLCGGSLTCQNDNSFCD